MVTAAERLKYLSGLAGVSAATMLLAIGAGATTGAALTNYSGLVAVTAAENLLHDKVVGVSSQSGISRLSAYKLQEYFLKQKVTLEESVPAKTVPTRLRKKPVVLRSEQVYNYVAELPVLKQSSGIALYAGLYSTYLATVNNADEQERRKEVVTLRRRRRRHDDEVLLMLAA